MEGGVSGGFCSYKWALPQDVVVVLGHLKHMSVCNVEIN